MALLSLRFPPPMKNLNLGRQCVNSNSWKVFSLTLKIASKASVKLHTFFLFTSLIFKSLTCLFACLLTHLITYTDDSIMVTDFIRGQSPQIINIQKRMIFTPTLTNKLDISVWMYFFLCTVKVTRKRVPQKLYWYQKIKKCINQWVVAVFCSLLILREW